MIKFIMPNLGADMEDGMLAEWRKQPGDTVKRGDIIADVETQKGLIEIEVFDEGIVDQLLLQEGEKVPVGTVMALIRAAGEEASEKPSKHAVPTAKAPTSKTAITYDFSNQRPPSQPELHPIEERLLHPTVQPNGEHHRIKVSPLARVMAEKNHVDLKAIHGSGADGAITRKDVEEALTHAGPEARPTEAAQGSTFVAESPVASRDVVPLTEASSDPGHASAVDRPSAALGVIPAPNTPAAGDAIRRAIAAAMSKSKREIPHYYIEKRMDMSKALAWLQDMNRQRSPQRRILMPALLIKAVARALDDVPQLNAVWEGGLQLKDEINIGFVVALRSGGIIVPAVLRADVKSVEEIMEVLNDLIPRAKALKLRSSELSDSTITLTSLGDGSADKVFGIIYPPQVAIVGFGGIYDQAFARDGMLGIAPIMVATLAGDHRASDGLTGSRFLSSLNQHLQNPAAL